MKRPTIKQLNDVRSVASNGWGDGDYAGWMDKKNQQRIRRSLRAFEAWLEKLQGSEFKSSIV